MRLGFLLPWKHIVSIGGGEGMMSCAFFFTFPNNEVYFRVGNKEPLWIVVESILPGNHIGLGI